jgi:hypothetical protein
MVCGQLKEELTSVGLGWTKMVVLVFEQGECTPPDESNLGMTRTKARYGTVSGFPGNRQWPHGWLPAGGIDQTLWATGHLHTVGEEQVAVSRIYETLWL